jgi:hypothetical protein
MLKPCRTYAKTYPKGNTITTCLPLKTILYQKSVTKFDIIWQRSRKTLVLHREVEQR